MVWLLDLHHEGPADCSTGKMKPPGAQYGPEPIRGVEVMVVINPTQRLQMRQLRAGFGQQQNSNAFKLRASPKLCVLQETSYITDIFYLYCGFFATH